jgi:hypothetical protein
MQSVQPGFTPLAMTHAVSPAWLHISCYDTCSQSSLTTHLLLWHMQSVQPDFTPLAMTHAVSPAWLHISCYDTCSQSSLTSHLLLWHMQSVQPGFTPLAMTHAVSPAWLHTSCYDTCSEPFSDPSSSLSTKSSNDLLHHSHSAFRLDLSINL